MEFKEFKFRARLWKYKGPAGWYFVTLPKPLSRKIRKNHGPAEEGWGRLKALAKINHSKWSTSIWYDKKAGSYLLPIKSSVRKALCADMNALLTVVVKVKAIDPKMLKRLKSL